MILKGTRGQPAWDNLVSGHIFAFQKLRHGKQLSLSLLLAYLSLDIRAVFQNPLREFMAESEFLRPLVDIELGDLGCTRGNPVCTCEDDCCVLLAGISPRCRFPDLLEALPQLLNGFLVKGLLVYALPELVHGLEFPFLGEFLHTAVSPACLCTLFRP